MEDLPQRALFWVAPMRMSMHTYPDVWPIVLRIRPNQEHSDFWVVHIKVVGSGAGWREGIRRIPARTALRAACLTMAIWQSSPLNRLEEGSSTRRA